MVPSRPAMFWTKLANIHTRYVIKEMMHTQHFICLRMFIEAGEKPQGLVWFKHRQQTDKTMDA